jgi:hypothetical protein
MKYHVLISATAIVNQVLEVEADSPEHAKEVAEHEYDNNWCYDGADGIEEILGTEVVD